MRRLLLVLAGLFALAVLAAAPASAHATVVGSDPADGARLQGAPATVTVSFDEPVALGSLGYLHVVDSSGKRVERGAAYHPGKDGAKIAVDLPSGLADGTYTESYRVVSADSHPVAGSLRFVVGNGPLTAGVAVASGSVNHGVGVAFDAVRWVSYAGLALLGGAWLLLTVWPAGRDDRRARRIVWTGWAAIAVGAVLELLLQGPYAAGDGLGRLLSPSLIDATLHTDYGQWHCARLIALGVLGVLLGLALQPLRMRSRYEELSWPLAVVVAFSFSATGHAETTSPRWLSLVADTSHLLAMAAWIGGLVLVVGAVLPRREPAELADVLPMFSRVAFTAVVVLAVTGTYAAWRGVGSWRGLTTEYGLLVLAKIALFAGLVALGNVSRRVVHRRATGPLVAYAMTDDAPALPSAELETERLRRGVLVELVLAGLVLAATSVLVGQPRGAEALAARDRQPVTAVAELGGGRTATVTVDPGQHGTVSVEVALSPGDPPKSLTATAAQPDRQLGPLPLNVTANGPNLFSAGGIDLPVAGRWVIALVLTRSSFDAVAAQVTITLS